MTDTGILVSLEDEDVFRSRVVLDYTSRDFTAIRAQLVGLAEGLMPEWETVGESSDFGTLLLELFAYMGDVMHFYIDRTASEAFLGTAVRRQSVMYIADMLGYRPIGQQAATVKLYFSLDANAEEEITLPARTRVYNETDNAESVVVFETDVEITIEPGKVDLSVTATEGVSVRDVVLGLSLGIPNSEYLLREKGIVYGTVAVQSDEAGQTLPWTFVTDLALARPTQPVFTTFLDDQDNTHVVFGDNAAGRIPPVDATMYVSYRYGVGRKANDLAPNTINTISASSATNIDMWGVTVRNPQSPIGGTDPETVESMRFSIPRAASRIKSRAVTLNDYADLAMQVPGVAKSVSYGTVYTAVHVVIAPVDGKGDENYMTKLCLQVEDYMKDKIIVGSTVYAEPHDVEDLWETIHIRLLVHVIEGYNRTSVRLQVESVITRLLEFNNVDFGWRVSIGKIYRAALAVQGTEWVELMWLDTAPGPTTLEDQDMAPITGNANPSPGIVTDIEVDPLLIPRIAPTPVLTTSTVIKRSLTSNVVTLTTSTAHSLIPGNTIEVRNVDATFNGRYDVLATPTTDSLTYSKTNADIPEVVLTAGSVDQISPPEDEALFPGLTEAERTHNGLWVWAVGGVPGT